MFGRLKSRISAGRVKYWRGYIEANRCSVRPGLTHDWFKNYGMDPSSFGGVLDWWECEKCGENDF